MNKSIFNDSDNVSDTEHISSEVLGAINHAEKKTLKTRKIAVFLAVIAVIFIGFFISGNTQSDDEASDTLSGDDLIELSGDDLIAYNFIYDAAMDFKNPASIRIVSGTLSENKDRLFCGISETNYQGARIINCYIVRDGSAVDALLMYPIRRAKSKSNLNYELISEKLEESLSNYK